MSIDLQKNLSWEGSLPGILYSQLFHKSKPIPSDISLAGKTAIVTGSNSGLGFEASRQLLQFGVHHLILAVRSQSRGDTAAAQLRKEHPEARIDIAILDMADYASVLAFADFCRRLEYIDYAVLNAALQHRSFQRCDQTGHEMGLQINYLSTALLALSLSTIMKEKKCARNAREAPVLSVVGSDTMWLSRLQVTDRIFEQLDNPKCFNGFQRYMDTKLLIMLFVYQMARLFSPDDVLVNVCNPGLVGGTNLGRETATASWFTKTFLNAFVSAMSRTVEDGASNYIHALVVEGRRSHGSFVSDWDIKP